MDFDQFTEDHGHVVTNALAVYIERMHETAVDARKGTETPEQPKRKALTCNLLRLISRPWRHFLRSPETISIRPTPGGFSRMAAMFDEAADQAEKALTAFTELTEGPDEEDEIPA